MAPTLTQFRPAWKEQAFLRFAGLEHRLVNSKFPSSYTTGSYPSLTDAHNMVPAEAILSHIKNKLHDLDENLTEEEQAEVMAYQSVVQQQLDPLLRSMRHFPDEQIKQATLAPMKKVLPFPLNILVPWVERSAVRKEGVERGLGDASLNNLVQRARECYRCLDTRLGTTSQFFFGPTPVSLDAVVFGHVAEAMADITLVTVLPSYSNLMRHFRLVCEQYFSSTVGTHCLSRFPANSTEAESLTAALQHANYANCSNSFNQLKAAVVCAGAPYATDPYSIEADQGMANSKVVSQLSSEAAAQMSEDERELRRGNAAFLGMMGSAAALVVGLRVLALTGGGSIAGGGGEVDDEIMDDNDEGDY
ncbi:unnamed protein product [Chrysoparadoxa australica]